MFVIHPQDNVAVDLSTKHKVALADIKEGENIVKYGYPIGHATENISKGEYVHTNNIKTNLNEEMKYSYTPMHIEMKKRETVFIDAYVRENGDVGIRNEIWIINTVGCVNQLSKQLSDLTGAYSFPHPFGCSQLGEDHETTKLILKGLVNNPNAAGVLVLGLGCENNSIKDFKKLLGCINEKRVKFLIAQEVEDEVAEGIRLINELKEYAKTFKRSKVPITELKVGLKCGGSDGFSGITANPLVGQFSDLLISRGGSTVLTEIPEMFGAEQVILNRCINENIFNKAVSVIENFKNYYINHNQVIYENPSPGNKEGGISTLEDKSLGCVQKAGTSAIVDVLDYGDCVREKGLNVLNGPGNDIVAITNLTAAGCQMILFTTGRGTPVGAPVPTIKISTNNELAAKKKNWIDFNAGTILEEKNLQEKLFDYVCSVANGSKTKNEINNYREISIFKDGVVL